MNENKSFDWNNFYSMNNAHLVEYLLDKETVTVQELADIFFHGKLQEILDFVTKLFSSYDQNVKNSITHEDDYTLPVNANKRFKSDKIIELLIRSEKLPVKLYRLPRKYNNNQLDAPLIDDYYEDYDDMYKNEPIKLFEVEINIEKNDVETLTYEELVDTFKSNKLNMDAIRRACISNKLGCYLRIDKENVNLHSIQKDHWGYLDSLREFNNGEPNYRKRSKGLERLSIKDVETLFIPPLNKMDLNEYIYHRLQTTDFETKFHLYRSFNNYNGVWSVTIDDVVFIEKEVSTVINNLKNKNKKEKPTRKRRQLISDALSFIIKKCNESGIILNKTKLPGNKDSWLEIMKKIKPELDEFKWTPDSLRAAFKSEGIIFNGSGRGLEKNPKFTNIKKLFE